MDIELTFSNGKIMRLSQLGFDVRDIIISSINMETYSSNIEGRHGRVDYGADYRDRTISVPFYFKPYDLHDFAHARDELFEYLTGAEGFYLRELRKNKREDYKFVKPTRDSIAILEKYTGDYVNGKRYFVRLRNVITIDQQESYAKGTLEFETVALPFAETFYTTMQLNNTGFSETEGYGLVDGINTDYDKYKFTTNDFYVWNAGNVDVEPESMYLKITLKGVTSTDILSISNYTNGSVYYHRPSLNNATIVIDGLDVKVNGVNALRDTGLSFLKVSKGRNQFNIKKCTFESIEFDFRFYYK